jgi:hypothetical protein
MVVRVHSSHLPELTCPFRSPLRLRRGLELCRSSRLGACSAVSGAAATVTRAALLSTNGDRVVTWTNYTCQISRVNKIRRR